MTAPFDVEDNLFLLPGPVKIHPRILRAMSVPAVAHRGADFKKTLEDLDAGLKYFFSTRGRVCVMTASATAGMEAAISNLLRPRDRAIVATNGRFGDRFARLAKRYAPKSTTVIESALGSPLDLGALERALGKGRTRLVAAVLNESSTGVRNDGRAIAKLCREHDAFFVADGVTSVGGQETPVDRWGIDVCIVGSQKCLGAPPGLAYVSCSEAAYGELRSPSMYLDLKAHFDRWEDRETPFTPATHLFFATRAALSLLREETLEGRIRRTHRTAGALRAAVEAMGLDLFPGEEISSDTITAVRHPKGVGDKEVKDALRTEFGITIGGGQGELKGKIFRVGHMGFVQDREVAGFVVALENVLLNAGVKVPAGAGAAVFASRIRTARAS